jgi:hypothetical protein
MTPVLAPVSAGQHKWQRGNACHRWAEVRQQDPGQLTGGSR